MFEDYLGRPIGLGDKVAVAFRVRNNSEIRTGRVKEFIDIKTRYGAYDQYTLWSGKILLEWDTDDKPSKINAEPKRFARI